ncbi:MAG: peptidoglycan-binding protein [Polyangiaceae bacterium]|nr:peptidoglycan-binding protein [Polyangiaceae bacterium]
MKPYVIKQGDYLTKLAHLRGFSADEVWNHAQNAKLKEARKNPAMLKAGDVLFVPDQPKKKLSLTKETGNRYTAKVPRVKVSVVLAVDDEPLAEAKYKLEGLGDDDTEHTTDREGRVTFEAPVHVREVVVHLVAEDVRIKVGVGDLDPADTPSGARMRLTALGYYGGRMAGEESYLAHDDAALEAATRAFQGAQGLTPTGELDAATREALVAAHGS